MVKAGELVTGVYPTKVPVGNPTKVRLGSGMTVKWMVGSGDAGPKVMGPGATTGNKASRKKENTAIICGRENPRAESAVLCWRHLLGRYEDCGNGARRLPAGKRDVKGRFDGSAIASIDTKLGSRVMYRIADELRRRYGPAGQREDKTSERMPIASPTVVDTGLSSDSQEPLSLSLCQEFACCRSSVI